jgi:hypothetical protein
MDTNYYLQRFQNAANQIDKRLLSAKQLEVAMVLYGDAVVLKLYKRSWANPQQNALTAETRIFFSVWINDPSIPSEKLFYNIHALKLRKLPGYKIESRKFADYFRTRFEEFKHRWPNVDLNLGPLTLMEGWIKTDLDQLENETIHLCNNFLEIEHLIDNTLDHFKR